jgi:hypothetical protein
MSCAFLDVKGFYEKINNFAKIPAAYHLGSSNSAPGGEAAPWLRDKTYRIK